MAHQTISKIASHKIEVSRDTEQRRHSELSKSFKDVVSDGDLSWIGLLRHEVAVVARSSLSLW